MAASLLAVERCFGKRGDKHRTTDLTRIEPTKLDPPKMKTLNKTVQRVREKRKAWQREGAESAEQLMTWLRLLLLQ